MRYACFLLSQSHRLQLRRTVPIPQAILDQYDALECKSFVGLFPEIARAFITIDNKLFLWNYYDGSDFLLYDELSQIIISVALSKPRPGVFVSAIQWVLTVSTPVEILVFALKFDEGNIHSPLQLFPTQFTIPSDHVHMTNIVGTEQGRILLAGKDGGIYELEYGNGATDDAAAAAAAAAGSGSWFGAAGTGGFASLWSAQSRKKCRKVNHSAPRFRLLRSFLPGWLGGLPLVGSDAGIMEQQVSCMVYDRTRNFLYTLASTASGAGRGTRSILSVFDLGSDGWRMTQRSKNENIASEVREKLRSLPPSQWEDLAPSTLPNGNTVTPDIALVALFPIPRHESAVVVLMGVTAHGHRIFFDMGETGRGNLHVKFVRLCPPACSPDELNRGALAGGAGARASSQKIEPRYSKSTSPSLVHAAYYKDGILLLADAGRSALGDTLLAVQREAYTARSWGGASSISGTQKLLESLDAFDLESRIAELGEVHESSQLNLLSSALYSRSVSSAAASAGFAARPLQGLSELATQHVTPNRHFLILTSTALLTLSATRPIDELRHALMVLKKTNDEGPLVALFHKYGAKEAGAMCLTLIGAHFVSGEMPGVGALDSVEQRAQNGSLSISSPNKMMGSGLMLGGAQIGGMMGSNGSSALTATGALSDDALRKLAKQAFFRIADLQMQSELSGAAGIGGSMRGASSSSTKLESIALYMSRWLRGHWDYSLCIPASPGSAYLTFRFSREYYVQMLQPLLKLQRFLHENQRLLFRDAQMHHSQQSASASALAQAQAQSGLADPGRLEAENFAALSVLLNITIEIFNLLILFLSYSDTNAIAAANGSQAAANAGSAAAIAGAQSSGASMLLHSSPFLSSGDLQRLRDSSLIDVLMGSEHGLISKLINTLAQVGAASSNRGGTSSGFSPRGKRNRRGELEDFDGTGNGADFGSASGSSGSSLIAQLHSACPTFFGESELLYYQALESLARARACWNMESERQAHLNRALATLSSFLHAPAFPLEEVAAKLKLLHQYEGIVQLALDRAQLLERREVVRPKTLSAASASSAGHGFGAPSSSSGLQGAQQSDADFYRAQKQRCVIVLLDTLNMLIFGVGAAATKLVSQQGAMNIDAGSSGSASQALTPFGGSGSRFDSDVTAVPPLSADALAATRDRVLAQLLSSPDRELHAALYRWYIDKNLLSELYSIHNHAVVEFLMSSEEYRGLLKDYYLRNERWLEAAKLLEFLASTDNDVYNMNQRIEFLTRALLCARNYQNQLTTSQQSATHGSMMGNGVRGGASGRRGQAALAASASSATEVSQLQDLIEQLKDRIEIAKIQADIFQKLQTMLQEVRQHTRQQSTQGE